MKNAGCLYVVATPIGNLSDFSARAKEILGQCDLIAAEDTRHTRQLLQAFDIRTEMWSYHDHNEAQRTAALIEKLLGGCCVGLVSDAGTPLLSDPGYRLVTSALDHRIEVRAIAGPSSVTAALSVAGQPTDRFVFEGFMPARRQARRKYLESLAEETRTMVFFESPKRLAAVVDDMVDFFGADRSLTVTRELTKRFEQVIKGPLSEQQARIASGEIPSRGEFVLVLAGSSGKDREKMDVDPLLRRLAAELPPKRVVAVVADVTGEDRQVLYRRLLQLQGRID